MAVVGWQNRVKTESNRPVEGGDQETSSRDGVQYGDWIRNCEATSSGTWLGCDIGMSIKR